MIEVERLCKEFNGFRAVDELTLRVPRGELFCFLGPNGAGKTTTLKLLTGLLQPTSGTARIAGWDIVHNPLEVKRRMAYIPDAPFLYGRLSCAEFLEFTAELYDVPTGRVPTECERLLRLFGLLDHRDTLTRDLSHGMRQRLAYAAALLHEPEVLFIDEPLIGLDPYTIRLIKDLLRERTRAGMTVFLTTHILALAEDIADRIGIILNGRLIALDRVDTLRHRAGAQTLEEAFLHLTAASAPEAPRRQTSEPLPQT